MALRICAVLGNAGVPGPGERRLLRWLDKDARFEVSCIAAAARPPAAVPRIVRAALALERMLFPAPDTAPERPVTATSLDEAKARDYDVVVDFSQNDDTLALARRARHGLWRLTSYDDTAGLPEARDGEAVTPASLLRHAAEQPAEVLATARYDTKFLATWNAAFQREASIQLIWRALAELAATGKVEAGGEMPPAARRFAGRDMPGYLFRSGLSLVNKAFVAVTERLGGRPGMFFLRLTDGDPLSFDPSSGTDLVAPGRAFWADPFLFEHDGALYLFYEEYDYENGLGHLSVARLDGDRMTPLGTALKRPYHLSYPFVFRWQDDILMIPETHAANRIEVWRATQFPTEWELVSVALEGTPSAENVVFEKDGQWWLFTNHCTDSYENFSSALYLYQVDSPLLEEMVPHPLNPVVVDMTTARGGGRVFEHEGQLLRISQNHSHGIYGFGLNVMEITRLDEMHYEERILRRILPDFSADIMACHHLDYAAGRVVIDMRRRSLGAPILRRR